MQYLECLLYVFMEDTHIGAFCFLHAPCTDPSLLTWHVNTTTLFLLGPFCVNIFACMPFFIMCVYHLLCVCVWDWSVQLRIHLFDVTSCHLLRAVCFSVLLCRAPPHTIWKQREAGSACGGCRCAACPWKTSRRGSLEGDAALALAALWLPAAFKDAAGQFSAHTTRRKALFFEIIKQSSIFDFTLP